MAWGITLGSFYIGNVQHREAKGRNEYWMTEPGRSEYNTVFKNGYAEQNLMNLFQTIPEIFAPIHEIASRVAEGSYSLVDAKTGEVDLDNAAWLRLSNAPNWQETFKEYLYMAVVYKYVCGNRYFFKNIPGALGNKQRPDNIAAAWMLPAQHMNIRVKGTRPKFFTTTQKEDIVDTYCYEHTNDGQDFAPGLVYHDPFLNLKDELLADSMKGITPLRACEFPITNLLAVYEARGIIYLKQGALGVMVSAKTDASGITALTKKEKQDFLNDYHGDYGLTGGRSPIAITNLPLSYIKTGSSIKELEPFTETEADAATIYTVLGVPTDMMPRAANSTFENEKSSERKLYRRVVIPEAEELATILTAFWGFSTIGRRIAVSFDDVDALQENKKEKSEVDKNNHATYEGRFMRGIWSLNQWLQAIGEATHTNPLYDKLIFDMTPVELETVSQAFGLKAGNTITADNTKTNPDAATNENI